MLEVNRKQYMKIRKMDHNTLKEYINEVYEKGVVDEKRSAENGRLTPEEMRVILLSMKGIGAKKADDIITALSGKAKERNELTDGKRKSILGST